MPQAAVAVLAGQPNSGKTSLFNLLTGARQYVGNWPGVTVSRKEGRVVLPHSQIKLLDLPGAYGLTPFTLEESITRNALTEDHYDLIVNVVCANALERQLYLTLQLVALEKPIVVVLTMTDELAEEGRSVDTQRLAELLRVPVVTVDGRTGKGIVELRSEMESSLSAGSTSTPGEPMLSGQVTEHLREAASIFAEDAACRHNGNRLCSSCPRFLALKYFEADEEAIDLAAKLNQPHQEGLSKLKAEIERATGQKAEAATADLLYGAARGIARETIRPSGEKRLTRERISAALDRLTLHPWLGIPVFLAMLFGTFQLTFRVGNLLIGALQRGLSDLGALAGRIPVDWFASLLRDGILGGVGNVLLVAPYVFIMFLLLSFLEDSGYMARGAYVMDRFMHKLGLHGKAFIPLVLGFGCNVPAVMAARSLESHTDRIKTILMTPFMSCSARFTVYVFFGGAFFGAKAGLVVFCLYVAGILAGLLTAFILSRTMLKKASVGFVMELPPYRLPRAKNLLINTWAKMQEFIHKAGTLIVVVSLVIWVLSYFPLGSTFGGMDSLIGRIGNAIAPIFKPMHFNPTMTVGLIAGFTAKEVVISTLGVVSGNGLAGLQHFLTTQMTTATALAYLVFILLYTPCVATVAVIRSETASRRWTALSVGYGLILAYTAALVVRTVASLAGLA